MKSTIFLVLFVILIGMASYVVGDAFCKCCFVLTSPTCQTRSIDSCLQCTSAWCGIKMDFCSDILPCYARCNTTATF
jgi:hypothetical protein